MRPSLAATAVCLLGVACGSSSNLGADANANANANAGADSNADANACTSACDAPNGRSNVARPHYNTGTGFFVLDGKLYDANGIEFRIRGVNKLHWDFQSPGIPKTHANTERLVIDFSQTAATNLGLLQQSIDNHIVPMPGNWAGTCDETKATLSSIVDTWVSQAVTWKAKERYMILNIANEWGSGSPAWRDAYIDAVARLRAAGYLCTISITSGVCGQDNDDLVSYGQQVFNSDPEKNVIFDQHIYGNWASSNPNQYQTDLTTGLDRLAATGLVVIIGEFGPGRSIGPSPTDITPFAIIDGAEARHFGWMPWAWDDPPGNADDTWFALSHNGDYTATGDLTMFGRQVVEDATHGLLHLAKPATIF